MKRVLKMLAFPLILLTIVLSLLTLKIETKSQPMPGRVLQNQTRVPNKFDAIHVLGGFGIDTPERAEKAITEGVQIVFKYGSPPNESEPLGKTLQSLHMKVIDGYISSQLAYYECHRTQTVALPPSGQGQFCPNDLDPSLSSERALLTSIATHLEMVKDNHLIIGYWVLDDWPKWDAGSAQQTLIKIRNLILQYTPGRPAICGFGGSINSDHTSGWDDWVADNFSPQGCDEVGVYIYSQPYANTDSPPASSDYDWSMSQVLPPMFASLSQRGWDITKEPLIGIAQAFGGPRQGKDTSLVIPDSNNIATQSKSFCEHGAVGVTFYGWNDTEFEPGTQTPMNSTEIELGIREGIAACQQYWSTHP